MNLLLRFNIHHTLVVNFSKNLQYSGNVFKVFTKNLSPEMRNHVAQQLMLDDTFFFIDGNWQYFQPNRNQSVEINVIGLEVDNSTQSSNGVVTGGKIFLLEFTCFHWFNSVQHDSNNFVSEFFKVDSSLGSHLAETEHGTMLKSERGISGIAHQDIDHLDVLIFIDHINWQEFDGVIDNTDGKVDISLIIVLVFGCSHQIVENTIIETDHVFRVSFE
mmetsp:Transcript_52770/g.60404  ORF Transcript_52770/g.60404 Transcript_52770/m.60404 type:complete len:217 (-) Transcript_52770:19-669(-)